MDFTRSYGGACASPRASTGGRLAPLRSKRTSRDREPARHAADRAAVDTSAPLWRVPAMHPHARLEPAPTSTPRRLGVLLVTGAPGWLADRFLGSLASEPPGKIDRIRCLVHRAHDVDTTAWSRSLGTEVEVVRGDLTDPASLRAAVRGVNSVVHGAGLIHVDRIRDYYDVNTEGTRLLTEAAAAAGAERFVFVSTNAAGGKSPSPDHALREDEPARPLSHY